MGGGRGRGGGPAGRAVAGGMKDESVDVAGGHVRRAPTYFEGETACGLLFFFCFLQSFQSCPCKKLSLPLSVFSLSFSFHHLISLLSVFIAVCHFVLFFQKALLIMF